MECVGQDNKISGLFPAKRVEEGINIPVVFVFGSRVSLWSYQDASFTFIMNIVIHYGRCQSREKFRIFHSYSSPPKI